MAGKTTPRVQNRKESRKRGFQLLVRSTEVKNGERKKGGCFYTSQEKEEEKVLFVHNDHHQTLQEDIALVGLLKACASKKDLDKGSRIHDDIFARGLPRKNIFIGSTLIDMYAKCGALAKAQQVFDELPVHNVVSWTTLIAGYAQHGHGREALNNFERMQRQGVSPNAMTFACTLKACGRIGAVLKGKIIHAEIVREGLLRDNSVLATALMDMYAKCGALANAKEVFDELPDRNVISWTALIAGYAQHGQGEEALNCFERMQCEGHSPNALTFSCILKSCGSIQAADKGKQIHAKIFKKELLAGDNVLGTALVDMYAKCGALAKARQIFGKLATRNVVSWTALISGYCEHGHGEEAINCFQLMQNEGLSSDAVTFGCILKACGSIGAAEKGEKIHAEIVGEGLLGKGSVLGSALVDMYAKCGALTKAQRVFDKLPSCDVVSWTALIAGYAQVGKHKMVFDLFSRMIEDGVQPSLVTFIVVLNACSFLNFVDKGQMYFETMNTNYGLMPASEHHTCMVGLFGRAGHFDKAMAIIEKMPSSDYLPTWLALLGACRKWGNVQLGRLAFERAVQLDKRSPVAYVCMTSIYAAAGMQEEASNIEALRMRMYDEYLCGC